MGDKTRASITFPDLPRQLYAGVRLLLDDGKVAMTVTDTTETDVVCRVDVGYGSSGCSVSCVPEGIYLWYDSRCC